MWLPSNSMQHKLVNCLDDLSNSSRGVWQAQSSRIIWHASQRPGQARLGCGKTILWFRCHQGLIESILSCHLQAIENFTFVAADGVEMPLEEGCSAFITMNPGYIGRAELPESLKVGLSQARCLIDPQICCLPGLSAADSLAHVSSVICTAVNDRSAFTERTGCFECCRRSSDQSPLWCQTDS